MANTRKTQSSVLSPVFTSYAEFAQALYQTGILSDPWFDGNERFRLEGIRLTSDTLRQLAKTAERVAYLHQELVEILLEHPELVAEFYHLTPCQQAMWETSGGEWHGMARADLFLCEDGRVLCCELNSDTPSGQPEAVVLNQLLHNHNGQPEDPNAGFAARFLEMLQESHAKRTDQPLAQVGIIYPTELTEDLGMMTLFRRWLEAAGIQVVVGSPFNLHRTADRLEILGVPVDLVVRHYKTDWWGERLPVWADQAEFPDPDPLYGPLKTLLKAELDGVVTVVNPFGAVVTQNKFSLAFFWEEIARFSPRSARWIRKHIPETYRMTTVPLELLRAERERWVLKSDYGCEGAETVVGPFVSDEIWHKSLDMAFPEHFVVQRFFHVKPDAAGWLPNFGVFVLGGSTAGFFTRLSPKSTGYDAVTVPTFVANSSADR
ncbi:MAG: glutathionylspermidine synthase family protein [Blastocatellia bacterium]|nr:glutathionylspermidine synthase family protein [Blastocatellia bacterium]